jgi:hypothetical protein
MPNKFRSTAYLAGRATQLGCTAPDSDGGARTLS